MTVNHRELGSIPSIAAKKNIAGKKYRELIGLIRRIKVGSSPTPAPRRLTQLVECLPYKEKVIGSNPISLTKKNSGVEQLVACRAHNPEVVGSSPTPASKRKEGALAQLREHLFCRQNVASLTLAGSTSALICCHGEFA